MDTTVWRVRGVAVPMLVALLLLGSAVSGQRSRPASAPADILWQAPTDIATRNLFYGPGSQQRQPSGPLTFVEEDLSGTKPKFIVTDGRGVRWKVKLGSEARAEVAATRLVWAVGYFVEEHYFRRRITVEQLPTLERGQQYVGDDGWIEGARLERKEAREEKIGEWEWLDNPFVGTRELNGLRVMMALVSNWDLTADNNAILVDRHGTRVYYVSDLGSSFGTGEGRVKPKRSDPDAYASSSFIHRVKGDEVDFTLRTCPGVLAILAPPYFMYCEDLKRMVEHIPIADARWIGGLLARLSARQITDAFRAAGYSPDEAHIFTNAVQMRIEALRGL